VAEYNGEDHIGNGEPLSPEYMLKKGFDLDDDFHLIKNLLVTKDDVISLHISDLQPF
jgi:hypothetical protein